MYVCMCMPFQCFVPYQFCVFDGNAGTKLVDWDVPLYNKWAFYVFQFLDNFLVIRREPAQIH